MSTSYEGIQNALDYLHRYTTDWRLQVNTNKTQIMVFRKSGCKQDTRQFKCGLEEIKTTEQYTYLGVTFKTNGSMSSTATRLSDKASKAARIQSQIYSTKINSTKIKEKLMNTTQLPILTYAGEIWGVLQNQTTWDKTETEKFHLRFCRQILNVSNRVSKIGCRMELGREPLISRIYYSAINYYKYLKTLDNNNLAYYAMNDMENNDYTGSWLTTFEHNIQLYNSKNINNLTKQELYNSIRQYYINQWNENNKRENSKLRTYNNFKNSLEQEEYIKVMNNKQHIKTIAKFRLSCHQLAIEKGRYTKPKTPVEDRLCTHCKEIEDERHHLIHCKLYTKQREKMFSIITTLNSNFINLDRGEQFRYILQSKHKDIITALYIYLDDTCSQ